MTSSIPAARDEASARLRVAGLKVTEPRLAVLDAIAPGEHLGADEVFRRVSRSLPTTSPQAIYGVLGALHGAQLLRRIEPAGSPTLYENRVGDNHHHLVCSSCGKVTDVDCLVGEPPCVQPSTTNGYVIRTAEVTFWGLCPECQRAD